MIFTPAKYAPYTPKFMTNFHKTMVANSLISVNIQKTQKSVFLMFMNDNIIHVSIALIIILKMLLQKRVSVNYLFAFCAMTRVN